MANEQQRKSLCSQVTEGSSILAWTATGEIYKIFCKVLNWNWMKSDAEINKASSCRLPSDHLLFDIQNLEKVPPALSWRKEKLDIHQDPIKRIRQQHVQQLICHAWNQVDQLAWAARTLSIFVIRPISQKIMKSMTTLWPHRHIMTSVYQSHQNHQIKRRLRLRVLTNLDKSWQLGAKHRSTASKRDWSDLPAAQNSSKLIKTLHAKKHWWDRWDNFCCVRLLKEMRSWWVRLLSFLLPSFMKRSKLSPDGFIKIKKAPCCRCQDPVPALHRAAAVVVFFGAFLPPQQPMARRVQTKSSLICRNAKEYLKVQFAKFIRISPSCIDCQVHWFSALISFLGMSWAFTFL